MKNLWKTYPVAVISLGVCLVFAGVTFAFSWQLATVELLFLLGCLAFELLHPVSYTQLTLPTTPYV